MRADGEVESVTMNTNVADVLADQLLNIIDMKRILWTLFDPAIFPLPYGIF